MAKKVDKATEYANVLRQADIFYDLTKPQLEMIAALCSEITPKAGEIIFEENSGLASVIPVDRLNELMDASQKRLKNRRAKARWQAKQKKA